MGCISIENDFKSEDLKFSTEQLILVGSETIKRFSSENLKKFITTRDMRFAIFPESIISDAIDYTENLENKNKIEKIL